MNADVHNKLRALGREISPPLLQGTHALYGELMKGVTPAAVRVTRDHRYGNDERHRLDIFQPEVPNSARAPVLMFVHGGGFVMGDKTSPGSPFYDNVGRWAASRDWVGVTMTYRLAPKYSWPSGAEDVGGAVQWLAQYIAEYGGDPARVFIMGQSAGAVHAATYIALPRFHGRAGRALAGGLLISGIYDVPSADRNDYQRAYFGNDEGAYAERSSLPGLMRTDLPLLLSVSELDGADFQRQAALFVATSAKTHNRYPRMLYLADHNHLSSVLQIGLASDTLGPEIERFVDSVAAAG